MSEPHDPSAETGESGAMPPEQPAASRDSPSAMKLARLRGRAGWGRIAIGLAATLLLIVLVATAPLWAPRLPWAGRKEPTPDVRTARVEVLQGLERRVGALEAKPAAPPGDLAEIRQEVAKLAARIDALDKAVHSQTEGDPTDIALVLALLQIRDAVETGRPFAAAYEALMALAHARPEIAAAAAPLAEPATSGVPGRAVLVNRLRELAGTISTSAPENAPANTNSATPDWAGQVWRRVSGLVTIRRTDGAGRGQPGGGPAEVVNGALQALAGGDLEGAVGALDALTGAPAEAARPWLRMAKERLAAEAALQKIEALLAARLGTPANAPAGSGPTR